MKTISLLYFLVLFVFAGFNFVTAQNLPLVGQGNQQWKINGNIADENHYLGTKNEFPIKFRTNDIERFRITSTGDIGIGTSTPESKLDVNGSVILRENLRLVNLNEAQGFENKILFMSSNGNVMRGDLNLLKSMLYSEYNESDGSCGDGGVYNDNNPTWKNGLNKIFYKCPQIKVGIGNDNPRVSLDVFGTSYSQKLGLGNLDPKLIGNSLLKLKTPNWFTSDEKVMSISNQTNEVFSINNIGDIETQKIFVRNALYIFTGQERTNPNVRDVFGIWSNNGKLLQVNSDGLLLVREIKLNQSWADYVFDKQYPLMPLNELEKFVKTNKHLPNVPSAKEIEDNGITLTETNRIFMEKIEELTLYLIEQDKDMTLLKTKINALEKELEMFKQK